MASPTTSFRDLTPYLLYLLLVATLGPLMFGYHLAELNAPSEVITCSKESIGQDDTVGRDAAISEWFYNRATVDPVPVSINARLPQCIPMNSTQFGIVSSFFTLGGLLGALAAGPISARSGALKMMIYTAAIATVGPIFEAAAPNIGVITIGRFISGLAAGGAMVIIPIYISEIVPPNSKGFFGSFTQVMVNVGILITQVLGYFLSKGQSWRIILGVGGAISLVQGVGLVLGGQESPKWTANQGRVSLAKRALRKLRSDQVDIDAEIRGWAVSAGGQELEDEEERLLDNDDNQPPLDMNHNADENQASNLGTSASKASQTSGKEISNVWTVIRHPDTSPAVVAVVMIMLSQQLTGINSIIMFGVSLLSDLLEANSALLNVAVSVLNVIITAAAAPLVDRLGRKTCLLMSITGMGMMSILLAIGIMRSIPVLSAIAVVLFVASFGLGLGPIPFILASELVGPEAVGATQSLALAASWIATFVVAQFFPMVNEYMGKGQVYFIFAAFAVIFGSFIVWWVPETKGKSSADEVWGRTKAQNRED